MGLVYENVTLTNVGDELIAKRGFMEENQIRQVNVRVLVDTGAEALVINENLRKELGLEIKGEREVSLADESSLVCKITEPVEIRWKNRFTYTEAYVLPSAEEILLGAVALQGLNVIVDPVNHQLVGRHGDDILMFIK